MQVEQLGAKEKCRGTTDNLLIDRMICQDSQRGPKTSAWRRLMYERHMTQQITNGLWKCSICTPFRDGLAMS